MQFIINNISSYAGHLHLSLLNSNNNIIRHFYQDGCYHNFIYNIIRFGLILHCWYLYGHNLAYAFLNTKNRNLDWTVLTNFLFIVMICFQINTLYYYFWASAFAKSFSSTSSLSASVFVSGMEATLTVVITASMFASRLSQLGLFVLTMI